MNTSTNAIRPVCLLLAGVAGLVAAAQPAAAKKHVVVLAQSTFDTNNEDWSTIGDAFSADYNATGGNPGGFISGVDQSLGSTWYFRAPAKFLGNRLAAYGQTLTYDIIASDVPDNRGAADVILRGGGITLLYSGVRLPTTSWSHFSVVIKPGKNWVLGDTNRKATAKQFKKVLANLEELDIRGEYITGPDTEGLDNVMLSGKG
jgi:hypothetical protein